MKRAFSITVDEKLIDQIKAMASEEGRSLSNMIEYLLRIAVERK